MHNTKRVWVVWQNTDLTEGKGGDRNIATCESRETAIRLGRGNDVQGTDCRMTEETAYQMKEYGDWYIPGYIHPESPEDKKNRLKREAKEAALEKAREVMSEDEIKALLSR